MTSLTHPGARPDCPHCHGLGLRMVRGIPFATSQTCDCVAAVCPACRDTGFQVDRAEPTAPVTRCDCRKVADRGRLLDAMQIPARYAHATVAGTKVAAGGMAAAHVLGWTRGYRPEEPNRGFVLWGAVGRGKTHLAIAAAREMVMLHGVSARFVEFTHLLADLKMSFGRAGGVASLLGPLATVDILVIDELGKGRNTDFEGTVIDELVSRRYNAGATILGTTNYEPKASTGKATANLALQAADHPALVDRIGERVFGRLQEVCDFWHLHGDDHRALAARKNKTNPRRG